MLNTCQYRVKELIKHHTHLIHLSNAWESRGWPGRLGSNAPTPRCKMHTTTPFIGLLPDHGIQLVIRVQAVYKESHRYFCPILLF